MFNLFTNGLMIEVNNYILEALERSRNKLSDEAANQIKKYLEECLRPDGGFVDRAGNPDPYYSVFGYSLAFVFNLEIPVNKQEDFIENWLDNNEIDFVHAVSLVRCALLISALQLKSKGGILSKQLSGSALFKNQIKNRIIKETIQETNPLLKIIETYRSKDNGFNHNTKNADNASTYASFLAWALFQDLGIENKVSGITKSIISLQKNNGSFVNEVTSDSGITTATAAGLIMALSTQKNGLEKSISWLKNMWINAGGFAAAEGVPIADLLSTSTALLALKIAGESMSLYSAKCEEFINLHWDNSGGFFGSVADLQPDCEYTYYALLALGLV